MPKKASEKDTGIRLDKWLWCARFYKTRGLAADAVKGGKVLVNGMRVKPSKNIIVGTQLYIRQKLFEFDITVRDTPKTRLSPKDAACVYDESIESIEKRNMLANQYKTDTRSAPRTEGKPGKHERRKLIRLRGKNTDL